MTLDELRACDHATLTLQQTAETLGVDYRTVSRACEDGTLPSLKLGRRVLIPRARLLDLLVGTTPVDEPYIPLHGKGLTPNEPQDRLDVRIPELQPLAEAPR